MGVGCWDWGHGVCVYLHVWCWGVGRRGPCVSLVEAEADKSSPEHLSVHVAPHATSSSDATGFPLHDGPCRQSNAAEYAAFVPDLAFSVSGLFVCVDAYTGPWQTSDAAEKQAETAAYQRVTRAQSRYRASNPCTTSRRTVCWAWQW